VDPDLYRRRLPTHPTCGPGVEPGEKLAWAPRLPPTNCHPPSDNPPFHYLSTRQQPSRRVAPMGSPIGFGDAPKRPAVARRCDSPVVYLFPPPKPTATHEPRGLSSAPGPARRLPCRAYGPLRPVRIPPRLRPEPALVGRPSLLARCWPRAAARPPAALHFFHPPCRTRCSTTPRRPDHARSEVTHYEVGHLGMRAHN